MRPAANASSVFVFPSCAGPNVTVDLAAPLPPPNAYHFIFAQYPLSGCVRFYGFSAAMGTVTCLLCGLIAAACLRLVRFSSWPHRVMYSVFTASFAIRFGYLADLWAQVATATTYRDAFDVGVWFGITFVPFDAAATLLLSTTDLLLAYFWSRDGGYCPTPARHHVAFVGTLAALVVAAVAYDCWYLFAPRFPVTDHNGPPASAGNASATRHNDSAAVGDGGRESRYDRVRHAATCVQSDGLREWIWALQVMGLVCFVASCLHIYCLGSWFARLRRANLRWHDKSVRPFISRAMVIGVTTALSGFVRAFQICMRAWGPGVFHSGGASLNTPSYAGAYFTFLLYVCPLVVMAAFFGLRDRRKDGTQSGSVSSSGGPVSAGPSAYGGAADGAVVGGRSTGGYRVLENGTVHYSLSAFLMAASESHFSGDGDAAADESRQLVNDEYSHAGPGDVSDESLTLYHQE